MSVAEMKVQVINEITKVDDEALLQQILSMLEDAGGKKLTAMG